MSMNTLMRGLGSSMHLILPFSSKPDIFPEVDLLSPFFEKNPPPHPMKYGGGGFLHPVMTDGPGSGITNKG